MTKVTIIISLLLLILFSFACKKDKTLTKHGIQEFIGNYCVTCEGHQVFYLPGQDQDRYRSIDTIFMDTLSVIDDIEFTFEGTPFQILKVKVKQYPYAQNSLFEVKKMGENKFSFPAVYDSYECKCGETIKFQQDSVFFHFHNVWMSDQPSFDCKGSKKN